MCLLYFECYCIFLKNVIQYYVKLKLGENNELTGLENVGEEQDEISDIDFNIDDVVENCEYEE